MAATLAVGSFMPFLGLIALLMILVSFYNVAFVRSFLVVIVMTVVVFFARGIIAPVQRFLDTWKRRLSGAATRAYASSRVPRFCPLASRGQRSGIRWCVHQLAPQRHTRNSSKAWSPQGMARGWD